MDLGLDEKVLACFYKHKEFCATTQQFLKMTHFESAIDANMFKMAQDFYRKYNCIITDHGFADSVSHMVTKRILAENEVTAYVEKFNKIKAMDISDHEFVQAKIIEFVKTQEIKIVIEDSVTKYLPKGEVDKIEKEFARIAGISGVANVEGVNYFSEKRIQERFERRERMKTEFIRGITTGIRQLDEALMYGGWWKRELVAILGDNKMGKTQFLLWLANAAAWAGYRVGYWTFETSTEVLEDRLDALNVYVPIKHVTQESGRIIEQMMNNRPSGDIVFFEYPTRTCTMVQCQRDLMRQVVIGEPIDLIIWDYLDIAKSTRRFDSKWDEQASVFEEARALLGRPEKGGFDIPGLTGLQIGQKGSNKQIASASDNAGAYEKLAIVDGALTISATDQERMEEKMYINLSRFRNAPKKTFMIKTDYAHGRFYKEFIQTVV